MSVRRALSIAFFALCLLTVACGAATPTPAQDFANASMTASELSCIANADGSLSSADKCLAAVRASYCADGGSLSGHCPDAGGQ